MGTRGTGPIAKGLDLAPAPHADVYDRVREAAKWLQAGCAVGGAYRFAQLYLAHLLMRAKMTRRWHISKPSKSTSRGVCNRDVICCAVRTKVRRGHANAHVQRLPRAVARVGCADYLKKDGRHMINVNELFGTSTFRVARVCSADYRQGFEKENGAHHEPDDGAAHVKELSRTRAWRP
jgi:hypothetical protein